MKKNSKRILLLVSLIIYFFNSKIISLEFYNYTFLFIKNVFPSTFLFLLLSYLLFQYNILFYISKIFKRKDICFYIISIFSGFPGGTIFLKESLNNGDITISEANKMIKYTHFPNPLFVLVHTSNLFSSVKTSFVFYGIILISQFLLLIFFQNNRYFNSNKKEEISFSNSLIMCSYKVLHVVFTIYVTSIFFYLISFFIIRFFSLNQYFYVFIVGLFDLTSGVLSTSFISDTFIKGLFLAFFFVFNSIPIHIQIKSILADTSISYSSFLKGRILSFILFTLFWKIYTCCAISI